MRGARQQNLENTRYCRHGMDYRQIDRGAYIDNAFSHVQVYRMKHLITGLYLSVTKDNAITMLARYAQDTTTQNNTLWYLKPLSEEETNTSNGLAVNGMSLFIVHHRTGGLLNASGHKPVLTGLGGMAPILFTTVEDDDDSTPSPYEENDGAMDATSFEATFSLRVGTDSDLHRILWSRNSQRCLSRFLKRLKAARLRQQQSMRTPMTTGEEKTEYTDEKPQRSRRLSRALSVSVDAADMQFTANGPINSLLARHGDEVEATLISFIERCTTSSAVNPLRRVEFGAPVRSMQVCSPCRLSP